MHEVTAGRMYTGPIFHKYNLVLRASGDGPDFIKRDYAALCRGNTYTTTLHVLNSCIVKLSKLTKVTKVYRGMGSGVLPDAFWKPNKVHVRGGVEAGFLSTTVDRSVAAHYASGGTAGAILAS